MNDCTAIVSSQRPCISRPGAQDIFPDSVDAHVATIAVGWFALREHARDLEQVSRYGTQSGARSRSKHRAVYLCTWTWREVFHGLRDRERNRPTAHTCCMAQSVRYGGRHTKIKELINTLWVLPAHLTLSCRNTHVSRGSTQLRTIQRWCVVVHKHNWILIFVFNGRACRRRLKEKKQYRFCPK